MNKTIPILINTIDAFTGDVNGLEYFDYLENLIVKGYKIALYGIGDDEPMQTFESLNHIQNFIKGHRRAMGI